MIVNKGELLLSIDDQYWPMLQAWNDEINKWEDRRKSWWFPFSLLATAYWISSIKKHNVILDEWQQVRRMARYSW